MTTAKQQVDQSVNAFKLGLELAQSMKDGLYSELEVDDLGSLIWSADRTTYCPGSGSSKSQQF